MSRKIDFSKPLSAEDRQYAIERGMHEQVADNEAEFGKAENQGKTLDQVREELAQARHKVAELETEETRLANPNVAQPTPAPASFPPVGGTATVGPVDNTPVDGEVPAGADMVQADEYETWTKADLQDEIEDRNEKNGTDMSTSGTKAELIERLRANDRSSR